MLRKGWLERWQLVKSSFSGQASLALVHGEATCPTARTLGPSQSLSGAWPASLRACPWEAQQLHQEAGLLKVARGRGAQGLQVRCYQQHRDLVVTNASGHDTSQGEQCARPRHPGGLVSGVKTWVSHLRGKGCPRSTDAHRCHAEASVGGGRNCS